MWCWHNWSHWETISEGKAEFVYGGGEVYFLRQKRHCYKCKKKQIDQQIK